MHSKLNTKQAAQVFLCPFPLNAKKIGASLQIPFQQKGFS